MESRLTGDSDAFREHDRPGSARDGPEAPAGRADRSLWMPVATYRLTLKSPRAFTVGGARPASPGPGPSRSGGPRSHAGHSVRRPVNRPRHGREPGDEGVSLASDMGPP